MATEALVRITILGLQRDKAAVLDFLQERGIVHLRDELENAHGLARDTPAQRLQQVVDALLQVEWIVERLSHYGKLPPHAPATRNAEETLHDAATLTGELHKTMAETISMLEADGQTLAALRAQAGLLERIPFRIPEGVALPHAGTVAFTYLLEEAAPDALDRIAREYKVTLARGSKVALLQGLVSDRAHIDRILREGGVQQRTMPALDAPRKATIAQLRQRIQELEQEQAARKAYLRRAAQQHLAHAVQLRHELTILHERYERSASFLRTGATFVAEGYVPKAALAQVKELPVPAHITAEAVSDAPTKLRNPPYVRNFEFITKMFGAPAYGRVDPTIFVSVFLPLFFGIMLSDVGYGILLFLFAGVLLLKSDSQHPILRDSGIVLLACAASTVIFGLAFGSFFGNLIRITPMLFDPFQKALFLLLGALGLGLLHLNVGIGISIYESLRQRSYRDAVLGGGSLIALQAGAACLAFGLAPVGWGLLITAAILLVLKSSIMGLMEITGFAGAVFSYARLLALGLATGGIALGINIMAQQLAGISVVGTVLFVIFILVGHLFNFIMNFLGSSIHSVRLQYIEFFSMFYDASGKLFKPFTTQRVQDSL